MTSEHVKSLDQDYICHTYARFDVCLEKGKGARCWSPEGKAYIDFSSGIGVNSLGFCDDEWVKAVTEQAGKLQHISNLYYTEPCAQLAELLCQRTGMKKVFFCNSGAEANEGAIKTARKYGFDHKGLGCDEIIALRTLADQDLDAALLLGFQMSIDLLKSEGKALDRYTVEARNFLLGERTKS